MSADESIKSAPPPPPPSDVPPPEDAGSRALEDALRSSFFIVKIIMIGLVVVFLSSGFFTVDPQHKAILLRFGKPVGEGENALLGPGAHWAWPAPIDEKVFIPFTSVQTADSTMGWYQDNNSRLIGAEPPPPSDRLSPASSSYALTADTNIIHVRASVRYTITDPIAFHFNFVDAPVFITNALNNALLSVTSQFNVDDILRQKKTEFHAAVAERLRQIIEDEHLGVTVEQPDVQEAPPRFLDAKFNEVFDATQRASDLRQKAETYAATNFAWAGGEAASITNRAETLRSTLVTNMAAQAETFAHFQPIYERNPRFFEEFRVMQTWNLILTNAQEKMVQPSGTKQTRLQISREPLPPQPSAP